MKIISCTFIVSALLASAVCADDGSAQNKGHGYLCFKYWHEDNYNSYYPNPYGIDAHTPFFDSAVVKAPELKQFQLPIYTNVDKILQNDMDKNCPPFDKNFDVNVYPFLQKHRDLCVNSCSSEASKLKLAKDPFNQLRDECQKLCRSEFDKQASLLNGFTQGRNFEKFTIGCGENPKPAPKTTTAK